MKLYQLGLEERYGAEVLSIWMQEDRPCPLTIKAAKTEGLIVVELDNADLANKILLKTRCKVHIKDHKY
jgi:hypothetical protein